MDRRVYSSVAQALASLQTVLDETRDDSFRCDAVHVQVYFRNEAVRLMGVSTAALS